MLAAGNTGTGSAYYRQTMNSAVLPLAMALPPFFHAEHPVSVQYGGLGSLLGREVSHGFDNDGKVLDYKGFNSQQTDN